MATALVLVAAGCSDGAARHDSVSRSSLVPLRALPALTARDCGGAGQRGTTVAASADHAFGRPGVYSYRTRGALTLTGLATRRVELPATTSLVVGAPVREGDRTCFRVQRRLGPDRGDTLTLVADGGGVYVTRQQSVGDAITTDVVPGVAIEAVAFDELATDGSFLARIRSSARDFVLRTTASGRYHSEVVGRRRMRVGGRVTRAVGVRSELAMSSGDLVVVEDTLRWFDVDDDVVVEERVDQRRKVGETTQRLRYVSRLRSLTPAS